MPTSAWYEKYPSKEFTKIAHFYHGKLALEVRKPNPMAELDAGKHRCKIWFDVQLISRKLVDFP